MSRIYKNKDTAIRHLKKGEYFFNTPFSIFWNNKDMFATAVGLGFKPHGFQNRQENYDWYSKWCWDEDFVIELFDIVWNRSLPRELARNLIWLIDYLPDSITSSDRYLSLCRSNWHCFKDRATGAAYESVVSDIERSDTAQNLPKLDSLFENHGDLIKKEEEVVIEYMSALLRHPPQIMKDREYCLKLVEDYRNWGMYSLHPFQDDIDFAIEVANASPRPPLDVFSYRIRSFVKDGDPRELLPRLKIHDELENSLAKKPQVVSRKLMKV